MKITTIEKLLKDYNYDDLYEELNIVESETMTTEDLIQLEAQMRKDDYPIEFVTFTNGSALAWYIREWGSDD